MQCEKVREQFTDYVIGQIEEPARSQVATHLMTCETCRTEAEELNTLWSAMGSLPAQEPSPELRSRFQGMLEAYEHGTERVHSRLNGWWPRQRVLQLAFSLGLLILGVVIGREFSFVPGGTRTAQPNMEITELRSELSEMRQMVALSLMQQQSASERLKGVNWSHQLQQPGGEVLTALLDTLMHDPNVNVRLATVDALRQFGDQPVVRRGVVEAMARQQSPMVQAALIDLAVDLHEKESIATLRQLTQDQKVDSSVRERAQKGIAELE